MLMVIFDKEKQKLYEYTSSDTPIFFSKVVYDNPEIVEGIEMPIENTVVVSALAQNNQFRNHCEKHYQVLKAFQYKDHHQFSESEVKEIVKFVVSSNNCCLLTTEKDWQRLKQYRQLFEVQKVRIYVLPIKIEIEEKFWSLINRAFENIYPS